MAHAPRKIRPKQPRHFCQGARAPSLHGIEEQEPMAYLLCAYGITFGTLLVYGIALLRERRRLDD